jgi:hypothetical protein
MPSGLASHPVDDENSSGVTRRLEKITLGLYVMSHRVTDGGARMVP